MEGQGIRWVGTAERPRVVPGPGLTLTAWTWWVNGPGALVARQDPGAPAGAGLHIAFPHWGYEHQRFPRPGQRDRLPPGYALVVGHHSHLPQPVERLEDGRLVAWSLGNLLTRKRLPVLGEGALLKVGLAAEPGEAVVPARAHYRQVRLDRSDPGYCRVYPQEEVAG
jgi:poly-gamma-glutamate capsule biosynthesis protein CapA/YwtB (metallophosphatase superfamily)